MHGGNIYDHEIEYDFSVNLNPLDSRDLLSSGLEKAVAGLGNYPEYNQTIFRSRVAGMENLDQDEVIGGSGASELFMAVVRSLEPVKALIVSPSFYGYRHALKSLKNCEITDYFLKPEDDFELGRGITDYLEKMEEKPDILFISNPNNPTGRLINTEVMDALLAGCLKMGIKVVVDECFIRLTGAGVTCRNKIRRYPNLYVVDAFTKVFSIPGARIGYLCSCRANIEAVRTQLPEWNLSVPAQELGLVCSRILRDDGFINESVKMISEERNYLEGELNRLGFRVFPSRANFILFKSEINLYEPLIKNKILIRDCRDYMGLEAGYYRIAVKTHRENMALIGAMHEIVKSENSGKEDKQIWRNLHI